MKSALFPWHQMIAGSCIALVFQRLFKKRHDSPSVHLCLPLVCIHVQTGFTCCRWCRGFFVWSAFLPLSLSAGSVAMNLEGWLPLLLLPFSSFRSVPDFRNETPNRTHFLFCSSLMSFSISLSRAVLFFVVAFTVRPFTCGANHVFICLLVNRVAIHLIPKNLSGNEALECE